MNRGVPPTARNARTGELTPPGTMAEARSKRPWETGASSGYGTPSARYVVVTAAPILSAAPAGVIKRVVRVPAACPVRSGTHAPDRPIHVTDDRLSWWSDPSC